jgi:hypothetical protein
MSNFELYQPLLEIAVAIKHCEKEIEQKPGMFRKSKLKKTIGNLEEKLTLECTELIDKTVDSWDSESLLSDYLDHELSTLKEVADESWFVAIDDVKSRLVKLAEKETSKSPTRRTIERNGWWIGIVSVVVIMLGLKWYWLVEVSEPAESSVGTYQRALALDKLLDYDDTMDTRVRRGGWLKGILFWPEEPTDEEIGFASEFLWSSIQIHDYLKEENEICGAHLTHQDDDVYRDELEIAQIALKSVLAGNPQDFEGSAQYIANAYYETYPCQ